MLVKEAMQPQVFSIHPTATLQEAAEKMLACGVDTLLVMNNEQPVGVIGLRDLFTAPIPASYGNRMSAQRGESELTKIWRSQSVGNQMNDRVLTVSDESPVMQAAVLMVNGGKHPLPVMHDGKVVGMLARADVVRALLAKE